MSLQPKLIDHIQQHGPMTVAEFMERANRHYYATRDPFGAKGDFTTAPEISQMFGELLGAWLAQSWLQLGSPPATLCELGPGRGTLMQDALRATAKVPGFHDALRIHMIETSPHLRTLQQQNLKHSHPRITWHDSPDTLPPLPLLLIANEFFDALPIHQYVKADGKWQERHVDYRDGTFVWTPAGDVVNEASPASTSIMAQLATHIQAHGGAGLVIDYGYTNGVTGDTLQAVKDNAYADPLQNAGEADLTAHVNFAALLHTAKGRGADCWGAVEQGTFLKRLGIEWRAAALCKKADPETRKAILCALERLAAPHAMGELFKVIALTSFKEPPAGF